MGIKEEREHKPATSTDRNIDTLPVSKFMTKTVMTANPDQTVESACKIMNENYLGSIVIVKRGINGNEPVAIITERDIIRKIGAVDLFTTQTFYKGINE
jgi:CBS domain-containing protein